MQQHKDRAIILSRIDYGERDRILTLLCQKQGKVSVLAKSVRSQKSRLAGGIELLSESDICYIDGRSNLKTLTAARLRVHFGQLVHDMRRMQQAFSALKTISSVADEFAGQEYYQTLLTMLTTLNEHKYDPRIVQIWFNLQVLQTAGSAPNLRLEADGQITSYEFDYDNQQFKPHDKGSFTQTDIKLLRLCAVQSAPPLITQPTGSEDRLSSLLVTLLKSNLTEL